MHPRDEAMRSAYNCIVYLMHDHTCDSFRPSDLTTMGKMLHIVRIASWTLTMLLSVEPAIRIASGRNLLTQLIAGITQTASMQVKSPAKCQQKVASMMQVLAKLCVITTIEDGKTHGEMLDHH